MNIEILRTEVKYYDIKKSGKRQLERITVFKCVVCDRECRSNSKKMKTATFTGKCKTCITRRKPFESLYKIFLWAAEKRGLSVDMTYLEFLAFASQPNCFYCDCPVPWQMYGTQKIRSRGYFLDRKDGNKGYSTENCVVCCKTCNFAKANRYSFEEFCLLSPGLKAIAKLRIENEKR
jgi:hypothetical protein